MRDWTFCRVCERTGNPETIPDLGLLIIIRHGVAANRGEEPAEMRERTSESVRRRNVCCLRLRACAVNCNCAIAVLDHLEVVVCSAKIYRGTERNSQDFHHCHPRYCTAVNDISESLEPANLRTFGLHWPGRLNSKVETSIILLGHRCVS